MTNKKTDDLDTPIWGARAIGEAIKKSRKATYHLLEHKRIPATKIGACWVSSRRRLQRALGVEAE